MTARFYFDDADARDESVGPVLQGSAIVGMAVNGVAIYGNVAAPRDDIFTEALTFDHCAGHPRGEDMYHSTRSRR